MGASAATRFTGTSHPDKPLAEKGLMGLHGDAAFNLFFPGKAGVNGRVWAFLDARQLGVMARSSLSLG